MDIKKPQLVKVGAFAIFLRGSSATPPKTLFTLLAAGKLSKNLRILLSHLWSRIIIRPLRTSPSTRFLSLCSICSSVIFIYFSFPGSKEKFKNVTVKHRSVKPHCCSLHQLRPSNLPFHRNEQRDLTPYVYAGSFPHGKYRYYIPMSIIVAWFPDE